MIETTEQSYLKYLKLEPTYKSEQIDCEICENKSFNIIREYVNIGQNRLGRLPLAVCKECGYLFHPQKFEKQFYLDYYRSIYRKMASPPVSLATAHRFKMDQGRALFHHLSPYLPPKGTMLQIGCESGGMLIPFYRAGWDCLGVEIDPTAVQFGRQTHDLPLKLGMAEDLVLTDQSFDFILIGLAAEHVFDIQETLKICRRATKDNGWILLAGRGRKPSDTSFQMFDHNHRRYFSPHSIQSTLVKHGWEPVWITDNALYDLGHGHLFGLGRANTIPTSDEFHNHLLPKYKEYPDQVSRKIDTIDTPTLPSDPLSCCVCGSKFNADPAFYMNLGQHHEVLFGRPNHPFYDCPTCHNYVHHPVHTSKLNAFTTRVASQPKQVHYFQGMDQKLDPVYRWICELILEKLSPVPSWKGLDIGAKFGQFIRLIQQETCMEYVGIEPVKQMATYELNPGFKIKNRFYDPACFPENQFDLITALNVLGDYANIPGLIATIQHHLKPTGFLVLANWIYNIQTHPKRQNYHTTCYLTDRGLPYLIARFTPSEVLVDGTVKLPNFSQKLHVAILKMD